MPKYNNKHLSYQNVRNGSFVNSSATLGGLDITSTCGFLTVIHILPINTFKPPGSKPLSISTIGKILYILFCLSHKLFSFSFREFGKRVD